MTDVQASFTEPQSYPKATLLWLTGLASIFPLLPAYECLDTSIMGARPNYVHGLFFLLVPLSTVAFFLKQRWSIVFVVSFNFTFAILTATMSIRSLFPYSKWTIPLWMHLPLALVVCCSTAAAIAGWVWGSRYIDGAAPRENDR